MERDLTELRLVLQPVDDVDARELDELTRSLREELLELPVEDVTEPSAGPVPEGAKAIDAAQLGTLLVSMSGAGGLLVAVVETVRSWMDRRGGQRVVVELGGNKLELAGASAEERERLISAFLSASAKD